MSKAEVKQVFVIWELNTHRFEAAYQVESDAWDERDRLANDEHNPEPFLTVVPVVLR